MPVPEAPDGIALIGHDEGRGPCSSTTSTPAAWPGSTRWASTDGVWTLERTTPDFSDLNFWQRFEGTLSADGQTIEGAWQICHDEATWEHDFDMTYTRRA